ncbi:MAG: flagellar basal body rod protein FlgB [Acetivibrionales bacterium]|jgi:flagellar basal-body rod protein FlgB
MFGRITGSLKLREKALDAAWLRNEAIAHNIANVDTPGYKRTTVEFEEHLENAIGNSSFKGFTTDRRHIRIGSADPDNVKIRVTKSYRNLSTRLDGNNVDIDSEMASLAKNNIRYNTLVQSISSGYQRLLSVISEGRR